MPARDAMRPVTGLPFQYLFPVSPPTRHHRCAIGNAQRQVAHALNPMGIESGHLKQQFVHIFNGSERGPAAF
jgi:hypothetical protein